MTPERRKYLTEKAREYREKERQMRVRMLVHPDGLDLGKEESVADTATSEETGGVTPEAGEVTIRVRLPEEARLERMTPCDRLFECARPNYYIYGKEVAERQCWACGKPYKTRMELNKFCSPKCKNSYLDEAFGKMRRE